MSENVSRKCAQCGAELPSSSTSAVCPRCAAAFLKAPPTEFTDPGGAGGSRPFTLPSVAELTPLFPQLEVLELIGQGGMGAVYKARQKELDRIVALKILPPGVGGPAFEERFAREARAMARLNHPNIVTIYDFGRANGLFYFLMEFVDGLTLRHVLRSGRISPREALAIVPEICNALQYAHDQGIVHRDIKPENILLDRQGRVKVADFGLAKLLGTEASIGSGGGSVSSTAEGLTGADKVVGTPRYMAPEQRDRPAEVDHRADIYALGVVFYQMLTGELPSQAFESPSKKVQIDVRLDEVVLRALEKKPELRYQQAGDMKTAVETIVQTAPSDAFTSASEWRSAAAPPKPWLAHRLHGWPIYAIAGLAVSILVCFGFLSAFRARKSAMAEALARNATVSVNAAAAHVGDVVPQLNSLGTVQKDTNSVLFPIPEDSCQEVLRRFNNHETLGVDAYNRRDEECAHGFLSGMDNQIDTATGTLNCRATITPEAGNLLVPGMALQFRMILETKRGVTVVPANAIMRDQAAAFVWIIGPAQQVTRRTVRVGAVDSAWAEILSGVSPGEIVVTDGFKYLREGEPVLYELARQPDPPPADPQPNQATQSSTPNPKWLKIQPLEFWLSDAQSSDYQRKQMAELALTEMGTNTLPGILKILDEPTEQSPEAQTRRLNASQAVKYMGPAVKSGFPAFERLLRSGPQERAYSGAQALAFSAPIVPEAFSILTNALTDPAVGVRDAALHGVGWCLSFWPNDFAEPALHLVVKNLKDPVDYVRSDAAAALMMYTQRQCQTGKPAPDFLIPPLMELLHDNYSFARAHAMYALACSSFREKLKPHLAEIQKLLDDPDENVRRSATNLVEMVK